jgi:transcriptional regulator with XRE-family HTH domain
MSPKKNGRAMMDCPRCNGVGKIEIEAACVGDMILAKRKAMGWTQERLSQEVKLSRAQVANIEGGRSDIPMKTLARFAEALETTMRDLMPG